MDLFELTTEPIDIAAVARRVVPPECGATVTLDGYARKYTKDKATGNDRNTEHLVYEAYEEMALKEMQKLISQAKVEFDIRNVGIVHRLGQIEIGETSVVISVAAPHRKAAFAACEWLIRELKRTVPIWKKEVYSEGESWVEDQQEMFTLDQIDAAVSVVRTAADFPAFVLAVRQLGVTSFTTFVEDGRVDYSGAGDFHLISPAAYSPLEISDTSDGDRFVFRMKMHQNGQIGYTEFCRDAAEAGIDHWVVDTDRMTCEYFDKVGLKILTEEIPNI